MTPDRFRAFADAYGGDVARWPLADRDAARLLLGRAPAMGEALTDAARLDAALATWTVPGPGAALVARIFGASVARRARARRVRIWLSSLGAATSLAGGAVAGAIIVALLASPAGQRPRPLYELSAFGPAVDLDGPSSASGENR